MVHHHVPGSEIERKLGKRIMAFHRTTQRLMFSDLAEALPNYTWHMLFCALGRLSRDHLVELVAHRWDYEVIFLDGASPQSSPSRPSQQQGDHHGQDERTHV